MRSHLSPRLPPPEALRVLVVDDSAVIRQAMAQLLSEAGFTVDTAADPLIGLGKMERARPDVILLDLELPRMDGLTFLRRLRREHPVPVVILSSHAQRGTETALRALEEGAVEVLAKPPLGVREFLDRIAESLVGVVRTASQARLPALRRESREDKPPEAPESGRSVWVEAIAIAASTGGPEALRRIFSALPSDVPGILVVQHMPRVFTGTFARRLDEVSSLRVREAEDGDEVRPGVALVAPGDRHLELARTGSGLQARLSTADPVRRHRPSADVLFQSVVRAVGGSAVGIVLSGMGNDGAEGLLAMRLAGAHTLTLDEASSVVYGMPGRARDLGAVQKVVSLDAMPGAILAGLQSRPPQLRRGGGPSKHRQRKSHDILCNCEASFSHADETIETQPRRDRDLSAVPPTTPGNSRSG